MMLWGMCVILLLWIQNTSASNILALCTVASPSHSIWCYQYMSALAERGHKITVVGVDEPKFQIPNMKKYIIPDPYQALYNSTNELDFTQLAGKDTSQISGMAGLADFERISTTAILHSTVLKEFINEHKKKKNPFDLIIMDNSCCSSILGLVPLLGNPPLLLATMYGSPQWMTFRVGNYFNPAYVPSMISPFDQHMTFYERCANLANYFIAGYFYNYIMEPYQDKLMREVLGKDLPYVGDIARRSNLIIVNHHFALHNPRPLLPGVVGIAGLHIPENPRPLPQNIKELLDEANEGAIFLSFGTNVKSKWLPENFEQLLLKTLDQLPQTVFWKWDKTVENTPKNVKIGKWFPQGDMLAHPNMRLFVSHCGLLSVQEAIYHKVPILALPIFLDQHDNAEIIVRGNLGLKINVYNHLTSNQLLENIQELLTNQKYKRNIEKLGELMRDLPQTAKQQAVFWTEYVLRHQGAPHLRTVAADMPWYQLLLLDVIALAILVLAMTVLIIYFLVTKLVSPSKRKTE